MGWVELVGLGTVLVGWVGLRLVEVVGLVDLFAWLVGLVDCFGWIGWVYRP